MGGLFPLAQKTAIALAVTLGLSGCETARESNDTRSISSPRSSSSPAPRYNLAGYSAAFKQGYVDACATPRRRNAARFKSDADYSMGWNDGQSACRTR